MKRAVAVCGAVAMMFVAASAMAMGKPDFTGKWTIDAEKTAAAMPAGAPAGGGGGRMGGGAAGPMTITQTATELKIERIGQDGTAMAPQVYKLDGSEQTMPMGQIEAKVKATVVGSTITVSTTTDRGNGPTTTTAVYSMDGSNLVIATTRPGRQGGEPTTSKVFYKKAS